MLDSDANARGVEPERVVGKDEGELEQALGSCGPEDEVEYGAGDPGRHAPAKDEMLVYEVDPARFQARGGLQTDAKNLFQSPARVDGDLMNPPETSDFHHTGSARGRSRSPRHLCQRASAPSCASAPSYAWAS